MATPAGYSGTPLPKKLGIRPGDRVLLLGAPGDLELDGLPEGATVRRRRGPGPFEVVVAFCADRRALERQFPDAVGRIPVDGAVWAAWPKKASGVPTDLDDGVVRSFGLATGLVDNKVCAIDPTWSGLRFVRRLTDR